MPFRFESLPRELRRYIYDLVLVQDDTIALQDYRYKHRKEVKTEVAPVGHSRDKELRGLEWDTVTGKYVPTDPKYTALLQANKRMLAEASPILYGKNKFMFRTAATLERFVNQIGDRKRHLRHVAIDVGGYLPHRSHLPVQRSFDALAATAKDLRTISVSHFDFCFQPTLVADGYPSTIQGLVEDLKPLLESLQKSYVKKNLARSVLDVVNIEPLAACDDADMRRHENDEHYIRVRRNFSKWVEIDSCECICGTESDVQKVMEEELKDQIVTQLGLKL